MTSKSILMALLAPMVVWATTGEAWAQFDAAPSAQLVPSPTAPAAVPSAAEPSQAAPPGAEPTVAWPAPQPVDQTADPYAAVQTDTAVGAGNHAAGSPDGAEYGGSAASPDASAAPAPADVLSRLQAMVSYDAVSLATRVVLALLLLIAGWLLAKLVAHGISRLLRRLLLNERLAALLDDDLDDPRQQEAIRDGVRIAARMVFYLLMLLVVVGVLQYAGLSQAAGPIESFVDEVMTALPLVAKALIVLLAAFLGGRILQRFVSKGLRSLRVDERLAELQRDEAQGAAAEQAAVRYADNAGRASFWLIMVLGLAGAFDALKIAALAVPLREAIAEVVGFLPALAVAGLIIMGGYLLARLARAVVRNFLQSVGFDDLMPRLGLERVFVRNRASDVAGVVMMAFILIQAGIAALNQMHLRTLADPLSGAMTRFWMVLPDLAVSALIVVAGIVAGLLGRRFVVGVLDSFDFDRLVTRLGFGDVQVGDGQSRTPSEIIGVVAHAGIVLVAVVQGLRNAGLTTWASYLDTGLAYAVQHVAVALVIVFTGFAAGKYLQDLILARRAADGEESLRLVAQLVRYVVLVFAFTMAITHLKVAENFVMIAFILLFGSLCLALALALGLGARDVASDFLRRQYDRVRSQMDDGTGR
jgi:hypothetical protein